MSLSHTLQIHITQLREIHSILKAMKNLALMEVHKLKRFKTMQGHVVAHVESVAMDFLYYYPEFARNHGSSIHLGVMLGAERGFCGDFNEKLLQETASQAFNTLIVVGNRLCNHIDNLGVEVYAKMGGASVAEEVPEIINFLLETIRSLLDTHSHQRVLSTLALTLVYHDSVTNQIRKKQLLPSFAIENPAMIPYGTRPILNLSPSDFYADLLEQYLLVALHDIFYSSLVVENQKRLQHLDGALNHIDDDVLRLQRKSQIYRQEEITEEIEVILLNGSVE
ncbi:MAG: F0F1 ATP synthase subunit gamma [Methylococcales bacterium]